MLSNKLQAQIVFGKAYEDQVSEECLMTLDNQVDKLESNGSNEIDDLGDDTDGTNWLLLEPDESDEKVKIPFKDFSKLCVANKPSSRETVKDTPSGKKSEIEQGISRPGLAPATGKVSVKITEKSPVIIKVYIMDPNYNRKRKGNRKLGYRLKKKILPK